MNFLLKPLRVIYVIYAAAVFLGIMFLILPPIFLASLLGKQKGGNIIFYFLRFWAQQKNLILPSTSKRSPKETAQRSAPATLRR